LVHELAIPALVQVYLPSDLAHLLFSHYWTLDAELVFYLLLPVGVWGLSHGVPPAWSADARRRIVIWLAVAIGAVSIVLSSFPTPAQRDHIEWFPMVMFGFAPGIALAALSTSMPQKLAGRTGGILTSRSMLITAGAVLVYYVLSVNHHFAWERNVAGVVAAGLILAAALIRQWSDGTASRALDNPALQWLGKRSYSFYLLHLLILTVIAHALKPGYGPGAVAVYAGLGLPVLICASAAGYRLFEAPFIARRPPWRAAPVPEQPVPALAAVAAVSSPEVGQLGSTI
jgi:peptidoglycan/LPS O-acetylase OafA/YrhL